MRVIKKILNIIQIPIKICLILLMVFVSFSYLNKVFITADADYGQSYHSLPEDSMDIIVLGSSHAQYSFVPSFIHQNTGLYSYVLGSPCQPLEVSYEMLKEALKTQSPKLVILEVYTSMPLRSICEADVCYVSAQYQMTGDEKYNTINYLDEEKAKTYYNDFLNNHNNWKNIKSIDDLKINKVYQKLDSNISSTFGYVYNEPVYPIENYWRAEDYEVSDKVVLDELDLISLNNIYELCHENNIELLLYKTPIDSMDENNQKYLNAVWDWANEKEVKYLDFFKIQKDIDYQMWVHSDSYHAFINGASLISDYISDYVMNNYTFNHVNNDMLDKMYQDSCLKYSVGVLKNELDPIKYLNRLNNQGIVLVSYNGKYIKDERLLEELNKVNINIENGENTNLIIKDGEVLEISDDDINYNLENHNIMFNQNEISIDDNNYEIKGDITILFMSKDFEKVIIKNIELKNKAWELGYDTYIQ